MNTSEHRSVHMSKSLLSRLDSVNVALLDMIHMYPRLLYHSEMASNYYKKVQILTCLDGEIFPILNTQPGFVRDYTVRLRF